jgi:acetyl esterase/lipase
MRLIPILAAAVTTGCGASVEQNDVVYDARHGDAGKLDLYLPPPDSKSHPAVMFIHGGSWSGGDKNHFAFAGPRLANSGFAVASINYRLVPDGRFPNDVEDCICALAFLRDHASDYDIDPDRIVVMGYSAGAQLASLVALASDDPNLQPDCDAATMKPVPRPAGLISASGPQDMVAFWNWLADKSYAEDVFGGTPAQVPDGYALGSPIEHVDMHDPPVLLFEDVLDPGGIVAMRDRLRSSGDVATLLQVSGSLHIFEQGDDPGEYEVDTSQETPEGWIAIDNFLIDTVGAP